MEDSPISVQRAFVVHFRSNSDVASNVLAGRVEHMASGQLTHFTSLEELLAFIGHVLSSERAASSQET